MAAPLRPNYPQLRFRDDGGAGWFVGELGGFVGSIRHGIPRKFQN